MAVPSDVSGDSESIDEATTSSSISDEEAVDRYKEDIYDGSGGSGSDDSGGGGGDSDPVSPGDVTFPDSPDDLVSRDPNADPSDVPDDLGGGVERTDGADGTGGSGGGTSPSGGGGGSRTTGGSTSTDTTSRDSTGGGTDDAGGGGDGTAPSPGDGQAPPGFPRHYQDQLRDAEPLDKVDQQQPPEPIDAPDLSEVASDYGGGIENEVGNPYQQEASQLERDIIESTPWLTTGAMLAIDMEETGDGRVRLVPRLTDIGRQRQQQYRQSQRQQQIEQQRTDLEQQYSGTGGELEFALAQAQQDFPDATNISIQDIDDDGILEAQVTTGSGERVTREYAVPDDPQPGEDFVVDVEGGMASISLTEQGQQEVTDLVSQVNTERVANQRQAQAVVGTKLQAARQTPQPVITLEDEVAPPLTTMDSGESDVDVPEGYTTETTFYRRGREIKLIPEEGGEQYGDYGPDLLQGAGEDITEVVQNVAAYSGEVMDISAGPFISPNWADAQKRTALALDEQDSFTETFTGEVPDELQGDPGDQLADKAAEGGLQMLNVPAAAHGLKEGAELVIWEGEIAARQATGEVGLAEENEAFAEGNRRLAADAERAVARAVDYAQERPAATTGLVAGSVLGSVGIIGGASAVSGRAGRAAAWAIQPGEELAITAARRGAVSTGLATKVPGVRSGHIGDTDAPSGRGADDFRVEQDSGTLDLRGAVARARDRVPTVWVERNPDLGPVVIEPGIGEFRLNVTDPRPAIRQGALRAGVAAHNLRADAPRTIATGAQRAEAAAGRAAGAGLVRFGNLQQDAAIGLQRGASAARTAAGAGLIRQQNLRLDAALAAENFDDYLRRTTREGATRGLVGVHNLRADVAGLRRGGGAQRAFGAGLVRYQNLQQDASMAVPTPERVLGSGLVRQQNLRLDAALAAENFDDYLRRTAGTGAGRGLVGAQNLRFDTRFAAEQGVARAGEAAGEGLVRAQNLRYDTVFAADRGARAVTEGAETTLGTALVNRQNLQQDAFFAAEQAAEGAGTAFGTGLVRYQNLRADLPDAIPDVERALGTGLVRYENVRADLADVVGRASLDGPDVGQLAASALVRQRNLRADIGPAVRQRAGDELVNLEVMARGLRERGTVRTLRIGGEPTAAGPISTDDVDMALLRGISRGEGAEEGDTAPSSDPDSGGGGETVTEDFDVEVGGGGGQSGMLRARSAEQDAGLSDVDSMQQLDTLDMEAGTNRNFILPAIVGLGAGGLAGQLVEEGRSDAADDATSRELTGATEPGIEVGDEFGGVRLRDRLSEVADTRQDWLLETAQETRTDQRQEQRVMERQDIALETRLDTRQDLRQDYRQEARQELMFETRLETRWELDPRNIDDGQEQERQRDAAPPGDIGTDDPWYAPGWLGETFVGFERGGLAEIEPATQAEYAEFIEERPGAAAVGELPTADALSGEVDVGAVADLFAARPIDVGGGRA